MVKGLLFKLVKDISMFASGGWEPGFAKTIQVQQHDFQFEAGRLSTAFWCFPASDGRVHRLVIDGPGACFVKWFMLGYL